MSAAQTSLDPLVRSAWAAAARAATDSGVEIGLVDSAAGAHAISEVLATIWPQDNGAPPLEANLIRALQFAGNYVAMATRPADSPAAATAGLPSTPMQAPSGEVIGACVGFFGAPAASHMHSHIAGITTAAAGRGGGRALKLHQRAWCLDRGITTISWTFDPLVSRNAHVNLVRLGATATRFIPDFYGDMIDLRNSGQASDRLVVDWVLRSEAVVALGDGVRHFGDVLERAREGGFEWITVDGGEPSTAQEGATSMANADRSEVRRCFIRVPLDIEALREADPQLAARWRLRVREAFERTLGDQRSNWTVIGFDKSVGYILEEQS